MVTKSLEEIFKEVGLSDEPDEPIMPSEPPAPYEPYKLPAKTPEQLAYAARVTSFLKDLTELSLKHKLAIGGCGCCGSPFIYECLKGVYEEGHGKDVDWQEDVP